MCNYIIILRGKFVEICNNFVIKNSQKNEKKTNERLKKLRNVNIAVI